MKGTSFIAWLPIVLLPTAAFLFMHGRVAPWLFMWLFAWTIFAGSKWLTWWYAPPCGASWFRHAGYLLAWPGLDARTFLGPLGQHARPMGDWLFALGKFGFGIALFGIVIPRIPADESLLRGWVGMIGIVFVLHFGVFHLLSLGWRAFGVNAKPLMDWPVRAESVSEFWGQRWNTAFRDLTHRFLFRPLTARFGAKVALTIGFVFSGIVHDLVVSLPAGAGFGLPTLYFLLQGLAIFFERSALGRRLGLGKGVRGWTFTMLVLVGPICLLFHPPFIEGVVVPFVERIIP